ncbi:hypothetical protein [Sphingomonas sp. MMS24-J13]|uniref:phage tail assembly chaperone n=1 Tax=Sphingomonas sp. MMS24-J13 TaxID=3238686 RepID=UPI00384CDA93
MKKGGIKPPLPPTSMPHIASRLMEIGPTQPAGMGVAPLSWSEINAWCDRTGIEIAPWEARLIRRLSVEYIAFGRKAEAENCPPPWKAEVSRAEIEHEASLLDAILG